MVVALAALPLSAGDHIDLNKSEKDVMYLDNPWGGLPIVSSEVGAVPQAMGDPETMNPVYGTCLMPGVVPSECTPDCAFNCDTPECSLNCYCGCNQQAKAMHTAMLAQMQQRKEVIAARDADEQGVDSDADAFRGDAKFWKNSLHALKMDERHATRTAAKLQFQEAREKRKANPRFQAHQLVVEKIKKAEQDRATARAGKRRTIDKHGHELSKSRDPFAEADGFSWDKFHPVNPYRVRGRQQGDTSPYAQEAGQIDNVFDPAEDWDNVGSDSPFAKSTAWWGLQDKEPAHALATDDHWWTHVPQGVGAGKPNPFGTWDNDRALGWF